MDVTVLPSLADSCQIVLPNPPGDDSRQSRCRRSYGQAKADADEHASKCSIYPQRKQIFAVYALGDVWGIEGDEKSPGPPLGDEQRQECQEEQSDLRVQKAFVAVAAGWPPKLGPAER